VVFGKEKTMAGKKFECVACGKDFDRETAVSECRVCHRTYCDQCLNEEGMCVPCDDKKTS